MMPHIKFTVGKTSTGFDAYYKHNHKIVAVTTGDTITELKSNALESYKLYAEESGKKAVVTEAIIFEFDLPSFFEYYPVISAKALSARVGINNTLLSQYVNGVKKPSGKQIKRIFTEIKAIGRELSELELA
ncbi:helix-turn-helix domain-containing protein [Mucilaginibacter sp. UYCu711]|uniref:helix-turn-helix domain-containing protein n=1 Tax=Mucilaginibacter sp. UYCu711 TaxID=3156339 RepID=UPI003D1AD149